MGNSLQETVAAAKTIIDTLGVDDNFELILFSDEASKDSNGRNINGLI